MSSLVVSDTLPATRILHVMWRLTVGGAERAVFQLVREQRMHGIEADVLVASELGLYGERVRELGGQVMELRCRHALDLRRLLAATRIVQQYDIVHLHGIEPLLIAAISRAERPLLVYTHRGGIRNHGAVKKVRLAIARRYLRNFAALSGNTRQSASVLAAMLGTHASHISVTYNGLDFSLLAPERTPVEVKREVPSWVGGTMMVGTASNLQRLKRVDLLLAALAQLPHASMHALVIGDGPARAELEGLAASLGLRDRVTFLGRKKHVGDYLQLLDAFVLPSGPQEAFGNAVVEAMGMGVPSIVFADGGGLIEHVRDGHTGFVVRDASELAYRLEQLGHDPDLRRQIGEAGRDSVRRKYSTDRMFMGYTALYASARARRDRGRPDVGCLA